MINRDNWKVSRVYIKYRRDVDLLSDGSLRFEEDMLRRVLEWADDAPFSQAPDIRPTLPDYLRRARQTDTGKPLASAYVKKIVSAGRRFFRWLSVHRRQGYKAISQAWLDTVKPPKMPVESKEHEAVSLDEIRAIASAPVLTLGEKRIRAAAVFLFLSGMRITAFLSLPLCAVDLDESMVKQWPSLGVRTKGGKRETTFLLPLPDLLAVVREWDSEVRAVLPERGLWFAPISSDTGELDLTPSTSLWRYSGATKDLRDWLKRVGLAYHSPHKFRHGHAVYALNNSDGVADWKAVSQNLMHESLSITDRVYGILSKNDVRGRIAALGKRKSSSDDKQLRRQVLREMLGELDKNGE